MSVIQSVSAPDLARELARRLRSGDCEPATVQACAFALESLATLYERSQGVLARALDSRGRLTPKDQRTPERK